MCGVSYACVSNLYRLGHAEGMNETISISPNCFFLLSPDKFPSPLFSVIPNCCCIPSAGWSSAHRPENGHHADSDPAPPPGGDLPPAAGETALRVILMAHCETRLASLVFFSSTGQWRAATSKGYSDLFLGRDLVDSQARSYFLSRHYAYGFLYWDLVDLRRKELLVLDIRRM